MSHVSTEIRKELQTPSKQPVAKAFEKMRNEVLEYFIKLRKQPEKVEVFIEQAYREMGTSDFAVITERVYDLVKQDEAAAREAVRKEPGEAVLIGKDYSALSEDGLVDNEKW